MAPPFFPALPFLPALLEEVFPGGGGGFDAAIAEEPIKQRLEDRMRDDRRLDFFISSVGFGEEG